METETLDESTKATGIRNLPLENDTSKGGEHFVYFTDPIDLTSEAMTVHFYMKPIEDISSSLCDIFSINNLITMSIGFDEYTFNFH